MDVAPLRLLAEKERALMSRRPSGRQGPWREGGRLEPAGGCRTR
jgi:hypothetical protein